MLVCCPFLLFTIVNLHSCFIKGEGKYNELYTTQPGANFSVYALLNVTFHFTITGRRLY